MKLLIFNNYPIIPPNFGGAVRVYKIANNIAIQGIETHVISPSGKWEASNPAFAYHPYPTFHKYSHVIGDIINMHLCLSQILISLKLIRCRKDIILQAEHIYSIYPAYFLKKLFNIPLVATEHNLEGDLAKKISKSKLYAEYLDALERFFLRRVDHIVCVSNNDKNVLINNFKIPSQKISVIPNGADINDIQLLDEISAIKSGYGGSPFVIFMGPTNYIPNEEAIKIIKYELSPRVKRTIPNVKFLIIGKGHEFFVDGNIIYTGYVKDVSPYIKVSDVAIAPLLSGGGTRIKLLEYFAAGKAVVSTTKGAEGIEVENNENVLIADDWSNFADKIIELIENCQLRNYIGKNAQKLIEKKYSWKKLANEYIELYKKILC